VKLHLCLSKTSLPFCLPSVMACWLSCTALGNIAAWGAHCKCLVWGTYNSVMSICFYWQGIWWTNNIELLLKTDMVVSKNIGTSKSFILPSDFPLNNPSSYWGSPMSEKIIYTVICIYIYNQHIPLTQVVFLKSRKIYLNHVKSPFSHGGTYGSAFF